LRRLDPCLLDQLAKAREDIRHGVFLEWQRIDVQQGRLPDGRDAETISPQLDHFVLFIGCVNGFADHPVSADGFRYPRQENQWITAAFQQGMAPCFEPMAKVKQSLGQKDAAMMALPFKSP
jgi:hypothetical protein